jgi:AcrR family transcriptional regulator
MSRITQSERPYRSKLRAAQAEDTRDRILDATMRVMATGLASLSVPAVAREAGVSVPTVYRHFRTKRDLLAAVYPHAARQSGLDTVPEPRDLDELGPFIRMVVERLDALDDMSRAAMASPGASEVRQASMPTRYERVRRLVDSIDSGVPSADRDRITRVLLVLTASSSLRMWRDHLERSPEEVADDIEWIARAAVAAASQGGRP